MVSVRCITAPGTRPVRALLSAPEAAAPARPGLAEERGALSSSFISNGTSSGKSRWWLITNIAFFFFFYSPRLLELHGFYSQLVGSGAGTGQGRPARSGPGRGWAAAALTGPRGCANRARRSCCPGVETGSEMPVIKNYKEFARYLRTRARKLNYLFGTIA